MAQANPSGSKSQCTDCIHWQKRGGLIAPLAWRCTAFEDEASNRVVTFVAAMAQMLAKTEQCPTFSTLHVHPDGYVSQEL